MPRSNEITFSKTGNLAVIGFNRPEKKNALNRAMTKQLCRILEEVRDNQDLAVIILSGAGENFISGADLAEFARFSDQPEAVEEFIGNGRKFMRGLATLPQFTVALVNGCALGGGLEIALACDYIIAGPTAVFGLPEVRFGIIPGAGATQLLPARIGPGWAARMILSGETIDAQQAAAIGLVDQLVADADFEHAGRDLSEKFNQSNRFAMGMAKQALRRSERSADFETENRLFHACLSKDEAMNRIKGFMHNREKGRCHEHGA
ncbi:MAG: enoyl-CoA hydratase/isomerase family protein [Candidatus Wallbacteria bacterium]|nr:enoyl-CoA hydratase/isomerase family protein [Candidatus Wallbacteria bacterium]